MHARGGLETEYLGEDWFGCVDTCVNEAKALGMEAWSYDENGWPSGFAGGKLLEDPANHARFLRYNESDTFPEGGDVLAVYVREGHKMRRVTAPCGADKYCAVTRPQRLLVCRHARRVGHRQIHRRDARRISAPRRSRLRRRDARLFHRRAAVLPLGRRPGRIPCPASLPKSTDMIYSITSPRCSPTATETVSSANDYYLLLHTLFINNFIKPIYEWCQAHGCKLTGHAVEEGSLSGQMWCCGGGHALL